MPADSDLRSLVIYRLGHLPLNLSELHATRIWEDVLASILITIFTDRRTPGVTERMLGSTHSRLQDSI